MIYARQSTAIIVTIGPILDANGVAVTDGVVADLKISKNGGAPAALNASATLTHRNTGHYSLSLTATDVNTVGTAEIVIDDTVNACPMKEITVIEEAIYDAIYAASANAWQGAAGSTKATGLVLADTVTTLTNLPTIPANWLTAAGTAADFGTEIGTAVWASATRTLTSLSGLTVDTVTTLTNLPAITANWLTAAGTAADFGTEVGTAVWASGTRTLTSLSGLTVDTVTTLTNLPAITANWLTATGIAADAITAAKIAPGAIDAATFAADVDAEILSYLVDDATRIDASLLNSLTNNFNSGVVTVDINGGINTVGSVETGGITALSFAAGAIDAAALAADAGTEIATAVTTAIGTGSALTSLATQASVNTIDDFLDTEIAAIKAKTDQLTFTVANRVDSTTQSGVSTLDAAGVRTAVGLASANLDTQLDALPTNAELATALGTADDAVLAAIAALNNVSNASVATAVLTTAMTEAYRSTGGTGTVAQLLYELIAHLGEKSISGTTLTLKKLDGSTTAKTYTLNSSTTPTSITETT